eukprot:gene9696-6793_t
MERRDPLEDQKWDQLPTERTTSHKRLHQNTALSQSPAPPQINAPPAVTVTSTAVENEANPTAQGLGGSPPCFLQAPAASLLLFHSLVAPHALGGSVLSYFGSAGTGLRRAP